MSFKKIKLISMISKLVFGIRVFMAFCFLILAFVMVYFRDRTGLSNVQTMAFAALLTIYGIFRIYRALKKSDDVFIEK